MLKVCPHLLYLYGDGEGAARGLRPRVSSSLGRRQGGGGEASWKLPQAPSPLGPLWPMCSLPTWAFQVRGSPYILNTFILFQKLFEILNKYILNISRPIRNFAGPPVLPGFLKTLPGTLPGARNFSGVLYSCSYHTTTQQIFHP